MGFLNLVAKLSLNASGFQLGMKRAESQAKIFAKELKSEFAAAFGSAALLAFSKKIIDTADHLVDLSAELGTNTKELQEWIYAAKKSGSNAQDVEKFFAAIAESRQRAMDGNEQAIDSYQQLGISVLRLSQLRIPDIGKKIAEAFKTGDPQQLIPFLKEIGGKSARNLIPAFAELPELFKEAQEAGAVWSEETLTQLKESKEAVERLADSFAGPLARAIAFVAGQLDTLFNGIKKQVAGAAAFWGAFSAGIDPSKDMTKFNWKDATREGLKAMETAQSEIQVQIDAQQKAFNAKTQSLKGGFTGTGAASRPPADRIIDFGRVVGGFSKPEGVSEWQKLGAAVRQDATTPILKQQLNAQEKMVERLDALRALYGKGGLGAADNGFGGGF
jgi:hypothetical protein